MSEPAAWTADDPEWLEVARIQLCLDRLADKSLPAEERLAAGIEYFDWLDREIPGLRALAARQANPETL